MRRVTTIGVAGVAASALMAGPLLAATTYDIDLTYGGVALSSQDLAYWDFSNEESSCDSDNGFTPLYDASYVGSSDGFDGGFLVEVDDVTFVDPDDLATRQGYVVKTGGAATVGPLKVNAQARAIQTSPTLQYLVKLRNPADTKATVTLTVSTDLGSDSSTNILGDSSGDGIHTNADRWLVSGDSASAPFGDPVVTQVLRGKNSPAKTSVLHSLATGDNCLAVDYSVGVPSGKTRYLLLFAELHDNTAAGKRQAIKHAAVYGAQRDMSGVLKGIPAELYSKIVNWNLKK